MSTVSGMNLKEPSEINWNDYNPGSKFQAPPPAVGSDGKAITYYGMIPTLTDAAFEVDNEGYRKYLLDPIKLVKSAGYDGYALRFARASVKPYVDKKTGKPKNASAVGNLLRSCGISMKPQKTAEYDQAVKMCGGKIAAFTIDWSAKNKDTGEEVQGYENFPDDPTRPGFKKAILRAEDGDQYRDKNGTWVPVTSEVLFANARLRFFNDPAKGTKKS